MALAKPETLCPAETGYAAITTVTWGFSLTAKARPSTSTSRPRRVIGSRRYLVEAMGEAHEPRQAEPGDWLEGRSARARLCTRDTKLEGDGLTAGSGEEGLIDFSPSGRFRDRAGIRQRGRFIPVSLTAGHERAAETHSPSTHVLSSSNARPIAR